jgi:hypothetical protein
MLACNNIVEKYDDNVGGDLAVLDEIYIKN